MIQGYFEIGTYLLLYVCVTNMTSDYQVCTNPEKAFVVQEKMNKSKYLYPYLDQHRHFTTIILSKYGNMGHGSTALVDILDLKLSRKCHRP